jgi:F-type H+-transporting ATPase subunit b
MNPLVQPDPGLYIWTILTFLVLVGLLAKFAWRPLLTALEQRQQTIRQSLDDARRAREEVQRVQADATRILNEARTQAESIIADTRSDANRLRDELRQKAQADAASLLRNAERQIELDTARALQTIRQEAVELSVTLASKLLQRNLTKDDNERLIEDTLRKLDAPRPH